METWEVDCYADLGRYVRCPACGNHSDLELDWPIAPEDPIPFNLTLDGKIARGCRIFHEDPIFAWLWFKWAEKPAALPKPEENVFPVAPAAATPPGYHPADPDYDYMQGV